MNAMLDIDIQTPDLPGQMEPILGELKQLANQALSFAKSLCPTLEGFLPAWRKLFGLGLQADSSTVENARNHSKNLSGKAQIELCAKSIHFKGVRRFGEAQVSRQRIVGNFSSLRESSRETAGLGR
jgi:hypothetical protein